MVRCVCVCLLHAARKAENYAGFGPSKGKILVVLRHRNGPWKCKGWHQALTTAVELFETTVSANSSWFLQYWEDICEDNGKRPMIDWTPADAFDAVVRVKHYADDVNTDRHRLRTDNKHTDQAIRSRQTGTTKQTHSHVAARTRHVTDDQSEPCQAWARTTRGTKTTHTHSGHTHTPYLPGEPRPFRSALHEGYKFRFEMDWVLVFERLCPRSRRRFDGCGQEEGLPLSMHTRH